MILKTINEWEEIFEVQILDPDGFDRTNPELYQELFTMEDFEHGLMSSTIFTKIDVMDNPLIQVYKVHVQTGNWCAFDKLDDALFMFKEEIEDGNLGTEFEISWMRKDTFENLQEFDG